MGMAMTGGWFMWVFWVVLLVLVLWGISSAVSGGSSTKAMAKQKDALDVLKCRYANGEIDQAEFEQKKRDLLEQ